MNILITGAGGFIGQELASALLITLPNAHLTLTDIVNPSIPLSQDTSRITIIIANLNDQAALESLLATKWDTCYLLHGIMSGGAEANFSRGWRVNFDSTRALLEHLRLTQPGVKIVFTSSTAVYGPFAQGQIISETTTPFPQSSYGAQKYMIETLLNDLSRRDMLDGRVVRLPTVIVRPGKPTAAASSFASGIVRESLQGKKSVLPCSPDLDMWVCSPRTVVKNLVHARTVPNEAFRLSRTVNLPGKVVRVQEILDALEEVGGKEARKLVSEERDEAVEKIVLGWPTILDTRLAESLGFVGDVGLRETVQAFADSLKRKE